MGQTLVLCGDCVSTGHVTCEGEQSRFVTSHGLAFDMKPVNDSLAVVEQDPVCFKSATFQEPTANRLWEKGGKFWVKARYYICVSNL